MSLRPALPRCVRAASILLAWAALAVLPAARGQNDDAAAPAGGGLTVPPVPDGTPEQLMQYVEGLRQPKTPPRSRQEVMDYMKGVAAASVQAADKILAQVKPEDAAYVKAAKLKLESLTMLGRIGDEQAAKDMAAYAATLENSPNGELAAEARRMLLVSEAQQMFSSGNLAAAPALVDKVVALVAANPDDAQTAGLAMQLAGAFEHMPAGEALAVKAFEALGPLFEKSSNPQVKGMGERFAGTMRRLSLPGKPMEITGTLLDGTAFDQKSLAGKVVLVDFWATWCGPCRAEVPNMKKEYEKYHDKGFEVVGISLDDDRAALEKYVAKEEIPWLILHEKDAEGGNALARHYGITGIPQLILIGRDGNVITLNARGPKLAEELEKLFKDG
ncbi:MAG: TlpA family protein disulfide reductase [Planctomycetaceae bacterium]